MQHIRCISNFAAEATEIAAEKLIDGVKIGGVGYYLGDAEDLNVSLFI